MIERNFKEMPLIMTARRQIQGFTLALLFVFVASGCDNPVDHPDADADMDTESDGDMDEGDADEEIDPSELRWNDFLEQRQGYLEALAPPIENCVVQQDTDNGVFHGCYDWHSAAHGVYALLALSRLTEDDRYETIANDLLTTENIAREVAALQKGGGKNFPEDNNPPGYDELPYGYAWFFTLHRERTRSGSIDLDGMADLMADGLYAFMTDPLRARETDICVNHHDNLSWAVFNLWNYMTRHGRTDEATWLENYTRNEILAQEGICPLSVANDFRSEFFPTALLRAMTIITVLPEAEAQAWIDEHVPANFSMTPISREELEGAGAHLAGLNFARSWGLYRLYRATGDTVFRDLYLDHIEAGMAYPEFWDLTSDYANSHWIAQFGVYGISLSFDE